MEDRSVQPHYIVGPYQSLSQEVIAMTRIRDRLINHFPVKARNLLPVNMVWGESIPREEDIKRWFQRLKEMVHIGDQYEVLANFSRNMKEPELCLEKDLFSPPPALVSDHRAELVLFRDFIRPLLKGTGHECRVEGPFPEPAAKMFKYFRFPLSQLTKAEMRKISEEHDFFDIMELTWFCHYPKHGLPCGKCRPCQIASLTGIRYTFYEQTLGDKIHDLRKHFLGRS
jgi:hypothetical protein